jgi:hypothetical protein
MAEEQKQRQQPNGDELPPAQLMTILTTEHYTLQMGRGGTIQEANGRSSLFLSTLSGALVAIGFVGQAAEFNTTFYVFTMVVLIPVFFLGVATFVRLLETAIEDMVYARGINRIRRFYFETAPHLRRYFVLSGNDDLEGMKQNMGFVSNHFQLFLTNSGMISVLNSVLGGVIIGMSGGFLLSFPLWLNVVIGAVTFVVAVLLQTLYQNVKWKEAERNFQKNPL